jgi:hypothetical protein
MPDSMNIIVSLNHNRFGAVKGHPSVNLGDNTRPAKLNFSGVGANTNLFSPAEAGISHGIMCRAVKSKARMNRFWKDKCVRRRS